MGSEESVRNYNRTLGLCITTYNRKEYLGQLLKSVLKDVTRYQIPIFISDNSSSDGTDSFVLDFRKTYPNVIYRRNPENLGLYGNFLESIKMADTEYIWTLGDDDIIVDGAIGKIMSEIENNPDFILVNSTAVDKDAERVMITRIIKCSQDVRYVPGNGREPFYDLMPKEYNTFISSMIIRRELISHLLPKYEDRGFVLYNNSYMPLAIYYEAIKGKKGVFLCNPLVLMRDNHRADRENLWEYFYIGHLKACEYLGRMGYDIKGHRKYVYNGFMGVIFHTLLAKHGAPHIRLMNDIIKKDKIIPLHIKLLMELVDITPQIFIAELYRVMQKFRGY